MLFILLIFIIASSAYAVQWPKGTYTLVKPKTGCPYGWKQGYWYQDNEDTKNRNSITPGHHFYGNFGRNMKFYYCTKVDHAISGTQHWPVGNYCILRQGISCPPGFKNGYIYGDDEDHRNANSPDGVLPSGLETSTRNTRMNYCCRFDGSYRTPINLPTTIPFYLLRYRSPCQQVQGMVVREEIVMFDDEDHHNKNHQDGSHPLNDISERNNVLYYCYYE